MDHQPGQEAPSVAADPRIEDAVKLATQEFTAVLNELGDRYPVATDALRAAQQEVANQTRERVSLEIGREKAQELFRKQNVPLPQNTGEVGYFDLPLYKVEIDGKIFFVTAHESGDDQEPCLNVKDAAGSWDFIYLEGNDSMHYIDRFLSDPLSYPEKYLAIIEAIRKNDHWIEPVK